MVGRVKPENAIRNIILDLGNVLLEWDVKRILASLSVSTEERSLLESELFGHQDWLDLDHGMVTETTVVARVCKRSTLTKPTVEAALLATKQSLRPIADTVALLEQLAQKDYKLVCLSNMSRESYAHIRDYDFFKHFDGMVISGIEQCMKPNEDIYHLTLQRYDLHPQSTLFIDDRADNIQTAQRLGIGGFHFKGSDNCYADIREIVQLKR